MGWLEAQPLLPTRNLLFVERASSPFLRIVLFGELKPIEFSLSTVNCQLREGGHSWHRPYHRSTVNCQLTSPLRSPLKLRYY